ncbi:membrane protein [Metamycoplasma subdolum]|uniref:Membrane protein n=1 Tax=Metamycoplasma subdolum TaxID=92407 RepID=A0A3M0AE86_9BACT|nr:YhjD/YihY/BrkB family envelope integrity protein [Metamycoplasma subdolum]RMA77482.1 membrane protein [Metamycoplasma subdolum]WPB50681.1 YhjD/YihY/BrkB family envelope integrity protein [Metamycoplasma subdolum]
MSKNKPNWEDNDQLIRVKKKSSVFEKIIKAIIYGILWIAIPRFVKQNKEQSKDVVSIAYDRLNSNEFKFIPPGYALYLFLSFIPIVCIVISVLGAISPKYDIVVRFIILGKIIPGIESTIPNMGLLWKDPAQAAVLVLFFVSVIWLTSGGYSKMIGSINALYDYKGGNSFFKNRLKGILLSLIVTLILTLLFMAATGLMTFLIEKANYGVFPADLTKITNAKDLNLTVEFWLVYYFSLVIFLPIGTYLGFLFFFRFSPNFKLKFQYIHPGALISAIPTAFFVLIFGSLTSIINYNKFGPVATFMYLLLLLSYMSYFIYAGLIVNASFYKSFINEPIFVRKKVLIQ